MTDHLPRSNLDTILSWSVQSRKTSLDSEHLVESNQEPQMASNTRMPLFQHLTPFIRSFRNAHFLIPLMKPMGLGQPKSFSTTSHLLARQSKKKQRDGDRRVSLIRYHLQHAQNPRPLRFSRMRALRHWTIHRAWLLSRRKRLEQEELELERYDAVVAISNHICFHEFLDFPLLQPVVFLCL